MIITHTISFSSVSPQVLKISSKLKERERERERERMEEESVPCLVDGKRRRPRVMCVPGWSSDTMRYFVRKEGNVADFVWADDVPMPPIGCSWCVNPYCAGFLIYIVLIISFPNSLSTILWICAFLILLPAVALLSFRLSIRRGVSILERHINRVRPDVILAFSWGGGILATMIAEKRWQGKTVLMSPCHHVMSRFCLGNAPSLASPTAELRVFCAQDDPFVPSKDLNKIMSECRGKVTVLRDDHRLFSSQSRLAILNAIKSLLHSSKPPTTVA